MQIKEKIQAIHEQSHQIYEAPQIAKELQKTGERITEKTVGNYMREMGIKAHWVKPYIKTTIHPDFRNSLKNILDEKFNLEEPNTVWVSDITYVWTFDGFVYLTSIMDLYSRKIICWTFSRTLEAVYVVEAVGKAKEIRKVNKPLVFHSDRGVQYVSQGFLEVIAIVDIYRQLNMKRVISVILKKKCKKSQVS